jgi:hypothetical protein
MPVLPGTSRYTNPISLVGHYVPYHASFRVLGTTNVIRMVGRLNPYVAVGIGAYDGYKIATCVW